jgi:hypothetical protein
MRWRRLVLRLFLAVATALLTLGLLLCWWDSAAMDTDGTRQASPVFTPERPSLGAAVRDFFGIQPEPERQPIAFTHKVHAENRIDCTSYCHPGAAVGPVAGIPGVKQCLICHRTIATDHPDVEKIAAYEERGEDIPWQRVYGYPAPAHVKFQHAPHIRAGVNCSTCHGEVEQMTVAVRAVELNMGFCVDCHRQHKASVECIACHY